MYLSKEQKEEIFGKYGKSNTDTGSPESQIALFSTRIAHLTEHLMSNINKPICRLLSLFYRNTVFRNHNEVAF